MTSILNRGVESYTGQVYDSHSGNIDVTTLADGSYIVAWSSSDVYTNGIYLRHYSANGVPLGAAFPVSDSSTVRTNPSVAALPDGGYAVTYLDGPNHYLVTRIFSADDIGGSTATYVATVSETAATALSNGGHANAFTIPVTQGNMVAGVYISVFSPQGTWTLTGGLMNTSGQLAVNPAIAGMDNGTIVAVWAEVAPETGSMNIYTRTFNNNGGALGAVTAVETPSPYYRINPEIVALADGYVIIWEAETAIGGLAAYGQVMDSFGVPVGTEFALSASPFGSQTDASVAALDDGGFAVVWSAYDNVSGTDVYVRRFDAQGHAFGQEERVNSTTFGEQNLAHVTALAGGGFVVAWNSDTGAISSRVYSAAASLNGNQVLYGTIDADLLDGGSGSDAMYGGWGDDTYVVNAAGDGVYEDVDSGIDTVMASIS